MYYSYGIFRAEKDSLDTPIGESYIRNKTKGESKSESKQYF